MLVFAQPVTYTYICWESLAACLHNHTNYTVVGFLYLQLIMVMATNYVHTYVLYE